MKAILKFVFVWLICGPLALTLAAQDATSDDSDAGAVGELCGDGVVDEGEDCDGEAGECDAGECRDDCTCPSDGPEACGPGYWKQCHHFCSWPEEYAPAEGEGARIYDDVFGVEAFGPEVTLLDALRQRGGGMYSFGRHSVAALLNEASLDVDYGVSDVLGIVQGAYADGDLEAAKDMLEDDDEAECPLGHCPDLSPCHRSRPNRDEELHHGPPDHSRAGGLGPPPHSHAGGHGDGHGPPPHSHAGGHGDDDGSEAADGDRPHHGPPAHSNAGGRGRGRHHGDADAAGDDADDDDADEDDDFDDDEDEDVDADEDEDQDEDTDGEDDEDPDEDTDSDEGEGIEG
jgi:hypothetical protein